MSSYKACNVVFFFNNFNLETLLLKSFLPSYCSTGMDTMGSVKLRFCSVHIEAESANFIEIKNPLPTKPTEFINGG